MNFAKCQGWIRFAFWLALAVTLVMALLPKPPALPTQATDKVQHIAAFAALTSLASLGFPSLRLRVIFVCMAALGLAIEVLQMIPTLHRNAEVSDWLADCAASAVTLLLCGALRWLSRRRQV
jgi:VanZ family protein